MLKTSDFKKGLKILIQDKPYSIIDFQHVKPGKGNQFTRTKLKNLIDGSNLDQTFKSGESFKAPDIDYITMNFLYKDEFGFHFMNPQDYEQVQLNSDIIGDNSNYLIENCEVKVCFFNEKAVNIELPLNINLKVTQTDPGFKGNTVTGGDKPATMETGLVVQVPLHINEGDLLKIDTRSGAYIERMTKS